MKSLIVLISNPAAKKASVRKVELACRFLESKGFEVEKSFTGQRGDAEVLARDAVRKSPFLVIAAGGDGTINEVMNGLVGSAVPMAILPMGTTNVLARELNIPENVLGASEIAVSRKPKVISLGKISFTDLPSLPSRHFCLMAGIGYDGETVWGINETLKKISGKGAYLYSGIRTLLKFSPAKLTFDVDGEMHSGYSAIIGNAAKYGGNFSVTPDARLTDPVLYVCIFKGKRRFDFFRYVLGILAKKHLRYEDVEYLKAGKIEISGSSHIQIDGDYLGMTPVNVEIVMDALRLVF
jgi:YegS/Rv2252/BmrU family lipid kinase